MIVQVVPHNFIFHMFFRITQNYSKRLPLSDECYMITFQTKYGIAKLQYQNAIEYKER